VRALERIAPRLLGPGRARAAALLAGALDGSSNPMTVAGPDNLIAPPGKITAKDP
jgi:hypothetical protein